MNIYKIYLLLLFIYNLYSIYLIYFIFLFYFSNYSKILKVHLARRSNMATYIQKYTEIFKKTIASYSWTFFLSEPNYPSKLDNISFCQLHQRELLILFLPFKSMPVFPIVLASFEIRGNSKLQKFLSVEMVKSFDALQYSLKAEQ